MIQNNILVNNNNSNNSLRFFTSLCNTEGLLQPSWGTGPATFSRASAQYVTDFEGVTRKVESNCVAVEGSRVVTNLFTYSEDLSNVAWTIDGTASKSANNVINLPAEGDRCQQPVSGITVGSTYRLTVTLSGSGTVSLSVIIPGGPNVSKQVTLSSTPQRYTLSTTVTTSSDSSGSFYPVYRKTGDTATSVTIHSAQLENVTGQINQNPGEYVRTTPSALSQCFSTTNGNTVDTNGVVTEATGTSLPQSYPERANDTAYALNDKIQVSGWWYKCTTAGTSDSSAPTFPQGKAGSQTVTDGTTVWTIGGRLLLGYVSEPASTNKVTAYGIIPEDTLGSEKITNGGFDSDTGWTKGSGWTISGGKLIASSVSDANYTMQALASLPRGKLFQITYTIVSISGGGIKIGGEFNTTSTTRTTAGTFTETILAGGAEDTNLYIKAVGTTTCSIDNISVKEVTWAVGTKSYWTGSAFIQNITGLTLSGDTSAILSIVTDETEITKAGLAGINPEYKVYKLDNSAGSATATVAVSGTTGNTNAHSIRVTARKAAGSGSSVLQLLSGTGATAISGSVYSKIVSANLTPSGTTQTLNVVAGIGDTLYFLLPQLEELPYATSVMPTAGATATRAATSLSYPTAGNLRGNDVTVGVDVYANAVPAAARLVYSYTDTNNRCGLVVGNTAFSVLRMVGGVNTSANYLTTPVAPYQSRLLGKLSKTTGASLFKDGALVGSEVATTDASLTSNFFIGSNRGTSEHFSGYLRNLRIWFKPLSDDRCKQLTL